MKVHQNFICQYNFLKIVLKFAYAEKPDQLVHMDSLSSDIF